MNTLYFCDQDIDNEDQIMVARLALVRKMLLKGDVPKEKQEKIIFGHIERKIVQEQEEMAKLKEKPSYGGTSTNYSTTNYSSTYNYTSSGYDSSLDTSNFSSTKKQKKHIETFEVDDEDENNFTYFSLKKAKPCKRDPKFKEYEKTDQLLGLSQQVLEFDRAFCEAHQTKQSKFLTIIESPDTNRNSNYMELIQDSNSILSYYQYDALNIRKRSINKQIQQVKKEFSNGYSSYPKLAEEYFRSISTISDSAKKCISYRKDKFVDQSASTLSSSSSLSTPSSTYYNVLLSFKKMPIIQTFETGKSIEAILYHRLLYVYNCTTQDPFDYQSELNGLENDPYKHFCSFIEKTSKSVLLPTSNLNESIGNLLSKIIGSDDESAAPVDSQKDVNGDTNMGEVVICNSEETTPTTMAVEIEIEGSSPSPTSTTTTTTPPQNVLHLLIDDLPKDQIPLVSTLLNDITNVKNVSSIYITATCRYSFPMDKFISVADQSQQSKVIRLPNLNVETSLNYLDHSISPLDVVSLDQFNPHDYPNLVRMVQFIGGHPGLNKIFEIVVKSIVHSNPKLHIKNISVANVLDNIITIVLNHQKQSGGATDSIPITILSKDNTDIPLLILLSLVGYDFEEAVAKFPIVKDYYNCGAISISNSSVYMAPILIRYYLTWVVDDFPFDSVFSTALSMLNKFTNELYIWNCFYQDFFNLKKQSYVEIQQKYPQLLESLGGSVSKITLKQFFYPNQSLENTKDVSDKPTKNNDEKEISQYSYRVAIESYWKKDRDLAWNDSNAPGAGNFTHFTHSPPNSFFFANDMEKKVKDCLNMGGADKQVTLFFSKKFYPITNTQYFKILDPIQSNYYTCFTTFINEINLEL